jgi:hypothetical protein
VLESDDVGEAVRLLRLVLPIAKEQLSGTNQLAPLLAAAKVPTQSGAPTLAATLLGAVRHHADDRRLLGSPLDTRWLDTSIEQLRTTIGDDAVDEELRHGATLTPEQAIQLAFDAVCHLAP